MGGPGSGGWYRWKSTKTTLDEVHRLDVRWLQRHGYLQRWARGVLTWHRGEHDAGAVGVALEDGRLVVAYRFKASGGDWEPVRQVLDLDWTPCHFGGQRPWFRCPGCQRRVAVLCLDGKWFLCRHCYELPYGSQQETAEDRHYRKVRKIRDRLGTSHNLTEPGLAMEQAQGHALAHVGATAGAGRAGPSVGAGGSGGSPDAAAAGLMIQQVCDPGGGGAFLVPVVYESGALVTCIFSRVLN